MFSTTDTIVAIATPPGRGGLGVIRIAGPAAADIAGRMIGRRESFAPRHATFGRAGATGTTSDHVVVTVFPAPHSYTGDEVAEVSAHGSPVILEGLLLAAMRFGARLAEPGEFTFRAFLNGKLDLVQAEAVADLVAAVTPLQARAAFDQLDGTLTQAIGGIEAELFGLMARLEASLDFPEEGYHFLESGEGRDLVQRLILGIDSLTAGMAAGRLIREGARVAIVGLPNVGKSSVFNALLGTERAIVTPEAGTTRDLVTELIDVGGVAVTLVDTAGLRASEDAVEREGVDRARGSMRVADAVIIVLDVSRALAEDERSLLAETAGRARVVAVNKSDLPAAWNPRDVEGASPGTVTMSATRGEGIETLRAAVVQALLGDGASATDRPFVTNVRHQARLTEARRALERAAEGIANRAAEEFVLVDLQEASAQLQEITGRRASDELLREIFGRFCIGK